MHVQLAAGSAAVKHVSFEHSIVPSGRSVAPIQGCHELQHFHQTSRTLESSVSLLRTSHALQLRNRQEICANSRQGRLFSIVLRSSRNTEVFVAGPKSDESSEQYHAYMFINTCLHNRFVDFVYFRPAASFSALNVESFW